MKLSPDADKAQVRQAVIELIADQERQDEAVAESLSVSDRNNEKLLERLEEAERRIELLSNALKSTLTSRPEPRPVSLREVPGYREGSPPERDWRPIGDGAKFWAGPDGFTKPLEQVPQEALERFQREKGTPRPEYEEEG